ncbi:MAG: DinB family protein [Gemmataceae bacterium]
MSLPNLIAQYLRGPLQLRLAVYDMTPEQIRARPVSGKWSTLEVVCHLADFDPILADRMKRIIAMDNPLLAGADENRFAATLAYEQRDVAEELDIIDRTRSQMARILRRLPADAFKRVGQHNERGPLTLEQMLQGAINHIAHHLRFINEKRAALGLPLDKP